MTQPQLKASQYHESISCKNLDSYEDFEKFING